MASALISLGIGSPADIPHVILFGLSINDEVIEPTADVTVIVQARARTIIVPAEPETVTAQTYARTVVVR